MTSIVQKQQSELQKQNPKEPDTNSSNGIESDTSRQELMSGSSTPVKIPKQEADEDMPEDKEVELFKPLKIMRRQSSERIDVSHLLRV